MSEQITVQDAASKLREYFGYVSWISAIGVSEHKDGSEIHLYLAKKVHPSLKFLEQGWMGYPVKVTFIGKIILASST